MPYGRYLENEEGIHATISSWRRVDDNMIPARGKITGSYVNSAFAKTDAQRAGFDEAIVLNQDGHVSEGSAENFFLVKNGAAVTPPVTDNILEGITRRTILELLRDEARRPRRRALDRPHRDHPRRRGLLLRHRRADRRDHARRPPPDRRRPHGPRRLRPARSLLRRRARQARPSTATGATRFTRTRRPPLSPKADASRPGSERRSEDSSAQPRVARGGESLPTEGREEVRAAGAVAQRR